MLVTFEEITADMQKGEMRVLSNLLINHMLDTCIMQGKIIKNAEIRRFFNEKGYKVTDTQVRQIIHNIRVNYVFSNSYYICASQKGYLLTNDIAKITLFKKSLVQRTQSINEVINSINI